MIQTEKLILKNLDLKFDQAIFKANIGNVRQYFIPFDNLEQVRIWIREYDKLHSEGRKQEYAVTDKIIGEFLGMVAMDNLLEKDLRIRMWIKPEAQGRGVAKEACLAVCKHYKQRYPDKRIIYTADQSNMASNALAKSIGFKFKREFVDEDGTKSNEYIM